MAELIQKFRSALNGFNREDVVQFIQTSTARHETELNGLRDENQRLLATLRHQEAEAVSLREEVSRLQAALVKAEALEEEDPLPEESVAQDWEAEELAAYRRAEEVERQSRERAAQLHRTLTAMVADASVQMDEANGSLSEIITQVGNDLLRLRSAMDAGKAVLSDTAASLRASGAKNGE